MKSDPLVHRFGIALLCGAIVILYHGNAKADSPNLLRGGDLQQCAENSEGPPGWDSNGRVVKEPGNPKNLVMQIIGSDEMGFDCPLLLAPAVDSVRVSFRILLSLGMKFDPEIPDATGVRLRVRLYHKDGASYVKERIIAPARVWQTIQFDFDKIGAHRARLGIEALWHADSIYFDDLQVSDRSVDPMQ